MAPIMGAPSARHIGDGPGKTLNPRLVVLGGIPTVHPRGPVRPSLRRTFEGKNVTDRIADKPTHRRPARSLRPHRSARNRIVAGVAAGLGEQLGVDPVVLRRAFVVLAVAGGFGLVLYLGLGLAGTGGTPEPPRRASSDARQVVAVA